MKIPEYIEEGIHWAAIGSLFDAFDDDFSLWSSLIRWFFSGVGFYFLMKLSAIYFNKNSKKASL